MEPTQGPSAGARKTQDILKAELERKSRDLYKVYNPTNQDYEVVLNAKISPEVWTIQAQEEAIVPWYVADKYGDEMADKIIYSKSDKAVIEENEKRMAKGFAKMDLHTEQPRFEGRNLKNLLSKKEQIRKILIRGLYKEYGIGGQAAKPQEIDKRAARDTFDPGIDVLSGVIIPAAPQNAPQQPEIPENAPQEATSPQNQTVEPTTVEEEPDEDAKNVPIIECSVCGKVFESKLGLMGHSRSHKEAV